MCCSTNGNLSNNTVNSFTALGKTIVGEEIRIVTVGINDGYYCNFDQSNPSGATCNAYYPEYYDTLPDDNYPPGRDVLNALTSLETGTNSFTASAYSTLSEVESDLQVSLCAGSGAPLTCSPATIANGAVGAYPSCAITCNTGYTLSNGSCVRG